jgi:hypothetical protein
MIVAMAYGGNVGGKRRKIAHDDHCVNCQTADVEKEMLRMLEKSQNRHLM